MQVYIGHVRPVEDGRELGPDRCAICNFGFHHHVLCIVGSQRHFPASDVGRDLAWGESARLSAAAHEKARRAGLSHRPPRLQESLRKLRDLARREVDRGRRTLEKLAG